MAFVARRLDAAYYLSSVGLAVVTLLLARALSGERAGRAHAREQRSRQRQDGLVDHVCPQLVGHSIQDAPSQARAAP